MTDNNLFTVPESSDPNEVLSLIETDEDFHTQNSVCVFGVVY